jgi:EamA-like transporter family
MPRSNVIVALITLSFLWGSSFLAIKLVIDVPPILAFGIRFAIAGAALLVAYVINERRQNMKTEHISKQQWKDVFIVAILIIVGGQGLLACGAQYLSSQADARDVSERYITKSNPYIVIVSTPNAPDGLFDMIEKESEDTCLYKRLFLDYTYGIGKIYTAEEIEKAKTSPSFEQDIISNI